MHRADVGDKSRLGRRVRDKNVNAISRRARSASYLALGM